MERPFKLTHIALFVETFAGKYNGGRDLPMCCGAESGFANKPTLERSSQVAADSWTPRSGLVYSPAEDGSLVSSPATEHSMGGCELLFAIVLCSVYCVLCCFHCFSLERGPKHEVVAWVEVVVLSNVTVFLLGLFDPVSSGNIHFGLELTSTSPKTRAVLGSWRL